MLFYARRCCRELLVIKINQPHLYSDTAIPHTLCFLSSFHFPHITEIFLLFILSPYYSCIITYLIDMQLSNFNTKLAIQCVLISDSIYFSLCNHVLSASSKTAITLILQLDFQLEERDCIVFKIPSQF